jgi:S1-C subfamily serine protease
MRYVAGCLISAVLTSLCTVMLLEPSDRGDVVAQDRGGPRRPLFEFGQPGGDTMTPEERVNVTVYDKVNKSVVNITTKSTDGFFLLDVSTEGAGSGSVIDQAGHVLTNYHVVQDAREVGVTLYNGKTYYATLVGADPNNDIAVIKIDAPSDVLHPVYFGDSNDLRVGMRIFAIGNPFGLERTMTTGIISSLNRSLQIHASRTIKSIIQSDAAINPGNSGGPLLDTRGRLIGINTAIASRTGLNSGVGFAIPVNLVARVVPQLIAHGRVIRAEIGIQRVYETEQGLLIAQLTPEGPAAQAGLKGPRVLRSKRGPFVIERIDRSAADMIVAVDGEKVETADDFLSYIERKKAGDTIELTIIRDGQEMNLPVVLGGGEENGRARGIRS